MMDLLDLIFVLAVAFSITMAVANIARLVAILREEEKR